MIKDKNFMTVAAFCPPQTPTARGGGYDSRITLKQYEYMAECGINTAYGHSEVMGTESEEYVFKALDLAAQTGIRYFVRDKIASHYMALGEDGSGLKDFRTLSKSERDELDESFVRSLDKYRNHPAFGGIAFWDEPGYDSFDGIAAAKAVFERECPDKLFYVNHFPYYITPEQYQFGFWCKQEKGKANVPEFKVTEGGRNIDRYKFLYESFIEKVKPDVFSYDAYPFVTLGSCKTGVHEVLFELPQYLHAMEQKNGTPFWVYLQAGGLWEGSDSVRVPTIAETRLGVYVPLLYGAKGLQVFPYMHPNDWITDEKTDSGLVDKYGEKTERFYWYKEIFAHVRAMAPKLLGAKLKGIIKVGKYKNGLPSEEKLKKILWNECIYRGELPACENIEINSFGGLKNVSATSQCLIGCMINGDDTLLLCVNDSTTEDAVLTLRLDSSRRFSVTEKGGILKTYDDKLVKKLGAGDCMLLEIEGGNNERA